MGKLVVEEDILFFSLDNRPEPDDDALDSVSCESPELELPKNSEESRFVDFLTLNMVMCKRRLQD